MSTGCEFYRDALVELAAERLEPERARSLEEHLAGCSECRETLAVIRSVGRARPPVPEGLDGRIQAAVRDATASGPSSAPAPSSVRRGGRAWRTWLVPALAAAALALWVGSNELWTPAPSDPPVEVAGADAAYAPYGAWPGSDGVVAGDVVWSELSTEELEALLEEMGS